VYVDGKLVRLGSKIRVSVNMRSLDGKVIDAWQTEAKTEDDLVNVLERISMAVAGDKAVEETLNLDNATMAEAQRQSNRFRIEKNLGIVIGHAFGFSDSMTSFTMVAFDGRFEIKDALIEINGGFALGDDIDFQFIVKHRRVVLPHAHAGLAVPRPRVRRLLLRRPPRRQAAQPGRQSTATATTSTTTPILR